MLGITAGARRRLGDRGLLQRPHRDGVRPGRARATLFRSVERFSLREVNEFGAPSLITRNTNDVQQVQMLVLLGLTMMITAPLTAIGGVIMALRTNVQLSALLLVIIPVMALVIGVMMSERCPAVPGACRSRSTAINAVLRENLAGDPGDPRVRAHPAARSSASPTPTRTSPTPRCG